MSKRSHMSFAQCCLVGTVALQLAGVRCDGRTAELTGEYDCKSGRNESNLYIKEIAPNKIQFALKTLWIGDAAAGKVHTGQSGGTMDLVEGTGKFEHQMGFKLKFSFVKNKCSVVCDDLNSFGGVNVDPNGTYHKVNSKMPTKDDLETYQ
ncbi:MAG TPA: hypothetical protein V6C76_04595 [Drouetiella sp.]